MSALSTAELAIYAVLSLPVAYVLFKHGRTGLLGWLYLLAFCTLRIVAGAMILSGSDSATIITNVGLSPLVLSAAGILHEVRKYGIPNYNRRLEWVLSIVYHHLVAAGLALLVVGSAAMMGGQPAEKDLVMVKAGSAILLVSWATLVMWALQTFYITSRSALTPVRRSASQLLWCVLIALIFTGIRIIYSMVALITQDPVLSPMNGSLAVRVVLSFLPQLIDTLVLLTGGILTRNICEEFTHELVPKQPFA